MDVGLLPKSKLALRAASLLWNYSFRLTPIALASALADVVAMAFPRLGSAGRDGFRPSRGGRSYYAPTEPLGSLYKPSIPIPLQLQGHFQPLYVTDAEGRLAPELINDLG
jgi:hypothetical protein